MDLNQLKVFFEIAKVGSFTRAAERLLVSQPALSKTIAQIENQYRVILFERSKKGVTLTQAGLQLMSMCQNIFTQADGIEKFLNGQHGVVQGQLRISASDHIHNYLFAKEYIQLKSKYPLIEPVIYSGSPKESIERLLKLEVELAFSFTEIEHAGVYFEPIGQFTMKLVCAKKYKDQLSGKKMNQVIQQLGLIGSISQEFQHHPLAEVFKLSEDKVKIVFESNSQEVQKRMCINGAGLGFFIAEMVQEELKRESLIELALPKKLFVSMYVIRRHNAVLSPGADLFLQVVRRQFKSESIN